MSKNEENTVNTVNGSLNMAKDKVDDVTKWLLNKYSEHPRENGMTATQHFLFALKLSGLSLLSSVLLLLHACAPWWFTTTGGDLLVYASQCLKESREMCNNNVNFEVEMSVLDETLDDEEEDTDDQLDDDDEDDEDYEPSEHLESENTENEDDEKENVDDNINAGMDTGETSETF